MKGRRRPRRKGKRRRPGAAPALLRWLPFLAAGLFLAGAIYRFDGRLSLSGDNAQFLILGESIAEGNGLAHVNEPGAPAHTKYPFLFPLFLALLYRVAPGSILLPKIAVLLLGAGAVYLAATLFRKIAAPIPAAAAALLIAWNPFLLDFSHQVLSEIPFLFVTLLALLLIGRWKKKGGRRAFLAAAAATLAAYFTRSVGLALVGAFLLFLLLERRPRLAGLLLLLFLSTAVPWAVRNRIAGGGDSYVRQFFLKNPYEPEGERLTAGHFLRGRVGGNLDRYGRFEIGRAFLPGLFFGLDAERVGPKGYLSLALGLTALAGLVVRLRERRGFVEIYLAAYLLLCLAWPEVWASIRFLLPVLPLLALALLSGVRAAAALLARGLATPVLLAVALCLLYSGVEGNVREKGAAGAYPAVWRNYFAVADWVKENTAEDAVVVCRKPYLFYVRCRRRTVPSLWSNDTEKVFDKIVADGADYVVVAPLSATTARYLVPAINRFRERFEPVLHLSEPDTYLLRLRPAGEGS